MKNWLDVFKLENIQESEVVDKIKEFFPERKIFLTSIDNGEITVSTVAKLKDHKHHYPYSINHYTFTTDLKLVHMEMIAIALFPGEDEKITHIVKEDGYTYLMVGKSIRKYEIVGSVETLDYRYRLISKANVA